MALPLAGAAAPIAANVIRLTGRALGAAAVGAGAAPVAAGAAGAGLAATVLPLAAAFGVGLLLGTGLLALWNHLNQAQGTMEVGLNPNDPATWPEVAPTPNLLFVYQYFGTSWLGPGETNLGTAGAFGGPAYQVASVVDSGTPAYSGGPNENFVTWAFPDGSEPRGTWTGKGGGVRLLEIRRWGGYAGPIPRATVASGTGVDRSPLVDALVRTLIRVAPAQVALLLPTPVPTRRENPKVPPIPGTPARAPRTPGPVPGGAPGRQPGGTPIGPGIQPGGVPQPGKIGEPAKRPAPATMPTRDPARVPQTIPNPGTAPLPVPVPVPVTPPDIVREGGLVIGDPAARPRPDLVAIATELGRQEQKLKGLLNRMGSPGGDATDLLALAKQIYDALSGGRPAGSYELYPPCGQATEDGPAPPDVAEWTASSTPLADLAKRVDALAMLIQYHKDQGQPTCKTRISGSPVTVNFISEPED